MNRDDSHGDHAAGAAPSLAPLTSAGRRQWLQGALALTVAGLTGSLTLRALADNSTAAPLDAFMTLSQALTGKSGLDRDVGARLFAALTKSAPDLAPHLPQLAGAFAAGSSSPRDQALALRIMEGWYLGTVDNVVVTYEEALMYRVVSDTLIIRSYCPNKPGFWAAKPVEKQS
ncbi:Membrane bound FAD containing D-sorbitol dehydrogenase [Paraburkholderia phenazinium]|uniref:Membrane bound FAD containing D-sorbitol dehydrogenase n=1 Tax=Paraburkholderia phenazinium TaxID=60549 RepID=A0A1G8HEG0_9BURK|nr:Membrane bound FAD containing D-sorbitol dehydrogenase [Paraburkholderia phenazinium]